jgi:hypothetical protein
VLTELDGRNSGNCNQRKQGHIELTIAFESAQLGSDYQ